MPSFSSESPLTAPIAALIWDMNGVLLDDERYQWESFRHVLNQRGVHPPDEDFAKYCGVTERECFSIALDEPIDSETIRNCMKERRSRYVEILDGKLPFYPGVTEAIRRAESAGMRQGIASGACREEVLIVAKALGERRFQAIVGAEDVSHGKPHPEGYLLASRLLGVPPNRCLVIEDSAFGVDAALSAGMACIAIASTLPSDSLKRANRVAPDLETALRDGWLGI